MAIVLFFLFFSVAYYVGLRLCKWQPQSRNAGAYGASYATAIMFDWIRHLHAISLLSPLYCGYLSYVTYDTVTHYT